MESLARLVETNRCAEAVPEMTATNRTTDMAMAFLEDCEPSVFSRLIIDIRGASRLPAGEMRVRF